METDLKEGPARLISLLEWRGGSMEEGCLVDVERCRRGCDEGSFF